MHVVFVCEMFEARTSCTSKNAIARQRAGSQFALDGGFLGLRTELLTSGVVRSRPLSAEFEEEQSEPCASRHAKK